MNDQANGHKSAMDERRQHERVQDAVALHIERLTDMPAAGQQATGSSSPEPQRVSVRKNDKYEIEGYAEVRRDHPEVANYIDALEERIRELLLGGDHTAVKPTHKVSLSAGGLSFSDKLLLQPGEMVGVSMTLFPSGLRIGTDAVVVSGNDAPEVSNRDAPTYRLRFLRMSDTDRDSLRAHVQQLLGNRTQFTD